MKMLLHQDFLLFCKFKNIGKTLTIIVWRDWRLEIRENENLKKRCSKTTTRLAISKINEI